MVVAMLRRIWLRLAALLVSVLMLIMAPFALAESANLVVLATPEFPPHFSQSSTGQGYYTEIVREALARAGYSLEVRFVPFERAMQTAQHGDISGILGGLKTTQRQQMFYFSEPVVEVEIALFGRANEDYAYQSLADLKGYRVGVMRGASISPEFDQAEHFDKHQVTSQLQNLSKLMSGRIDLFACEKQHIFHQIDAHHPEWRGKVKALEPLLDVRPVHIMLTKDKSHHQTIIEQFNQQLAKMRADGSYQHFVEKHRGELSDEMLDKLDCDKFH